MLQLHEGLGESQPDAGGHLSVLLHMLLLRECSVWDIKSAKALATEKRMRYKTSATVLLNIFCVWSHPHARHNC